MQHIYMVRHGQSVDNANKISSGSRETPLTQLGQQQSRQVGEELKPLGIDLIVSSPLTRARQTAAIIAEVIGYPPQKIVYMHELTERDVGTLTGMPEGTDHGYNLPPAEGVETLPHMYSRAQQALRILTHDNKHRTILIVSHFWINRMLKTVAQGQPAEAAYTIPGGSNAALHKLF